MEKRRYRWKKWNLARNVLALTLADTILRTFLSVWTRMDCGCDASSHNSTSKNKMERTIWAFAFEHYEDMENLDEEEVFKIHLEDIGGR
jgi:hypothetical protein